MANVCNARNRTIFIGDNLDILRGINSECVDLIYLDPPFNSDRTYAAPFDSEARGATFDDVWTLEDVKEEWIDEIEIRLPALLYIINGAKLASGESMAGYLTFMSVRLLELHRILKSTGSIYLHCDDSAVHYLKGVMDALFGAGNFLNNIVWRRATSHNDAKRYGRVLDHILFYSKGGTTVWNAGAVAESKDEEELRKAYPSRDERGRFRPADLTGPRHDAQRGSASTLAWKEYDVFAMNRVWSVPKTGRYAEYIEREFIPGYRGISGIHERLDALNEAGLIHHPKTGRWPGLKRYADADIGRPVLNLFLEPTGFTNYSTRRAEYTGWSTQKPVALLERIIRASSNPGDLVLDPFCGCATACIASEKLGREWMGIDIVPQAAEVLTDRAKRELQIPIDDDSDGWEDRTPIIRTEPPKRTDDVTLYRPADPQSDKELLYNTQQRLCRGCGYELPLHVLTIDHVRTRSKGGLDSISNLQLLCHTCNAIKGSRSMEYLKGQLQARGIMRKR